MVDLYEEGFQLIAQKEICKELERQLTAERERADALAAHAKEDAERIDWLEQQARKSRTGISFDWVPSCDGEPSGFRFMRRHFIGEQAKTLRNAIDKVMRANEIAAGGDQ